MTTEPLVEDRGGDLIEAASAILNADRTHRYVLTRWWADGPTWMFIMLNPSTADAFAVDPTLTRCLRFARRGGAGTLVVCNLFGLRSTDPSVLEHHPDPIGASNDQLLVEQAVAADIVVAGWGAHGRLHDRDRTIVELLDGHVRWRCLASNNDGSPRHPLYIRADAPLSYFNPQTRWS
ncbi:DUF1643 domain-containing protein [Umezawaea tangerina]|uniref:DUF1643 domain-containing protein n=1 Tax=Umezawaea tangerina TaxID=84725 RepID=A0A2T0SPE2_9PSEU|nr:DUF1643 domain-containing protein [Umezawaea tangerina]PRY35292.1 hypothetical protein CLV43_114210 [Umezawaea tangerina]